MKIQQQITSKLESAFTPLHLEVLNESHMHNVPPGSESHFKVVIVSDSFSGLRKVPRHQRLYKELSEELAGEVHALSLYVYTPEEWIQQGAAPDSPECLGGSKAKA